jgi:hypothetical protein
MKKIKKLDKLIVCIFASIIACSIGFVAFANSSNYFGVSIPANTTNYYNYTVDGTRIYLSFSHGQIEGNAGKASNTVTLACYDQGYYEWAFADQNGANWAVNPTGTYNLETVRDAASNTYGVIFFNNYSGAWYIPSPYVHLYSE